MSAFTVSAVVAAAFAALFATLFGRLLLRVRQYDSPGVWLREFSAESYRPMERLLDENDYRFLAQQPGYRRYIADELRAERKKVFQLYLSELVRDFNALVRIARLMLVYAPQDSPELARAIFRTQCAFYYQVTLTHLYLAAPGLVTGSVRPARLLEALKVMRGSIDQIGFSPALLQS